MDAMTLHEMVPRLVWVDWVLLAVLGVSVGIGLARGFVYECLLLAGWVAAWFGAQWLAPHLGPHLPVPEPGTMQNAAAAFALSFVLIIIAWSLLAKGVRLLLHATPLSIPDRVLGAGFGVLRGGVLLLAVATVVALTPAAQSPAWRASAGARWLSATLQSLTPLLPESVARLLRNGSTPIAI